MRVFIALELPSFVIEYVMVVQDTLRIQQLFKGTFPRKEHLHITLAWLPWIHQEQLPDIQKAVATIIADYPPFVFHLDTLRHLQHPHLIWLTITEHSISSLSDCAAELRHALSNLNGKQEHEFVPHITIARIKKLFNSFQLQQTLATLPPPDKRVIGERISIQQSTLSTNGPHYTTLHTYDLQKRELP
jgi:RNA 2',3'-cyclic 3'-phosphodiesterase